MMDKKAKYIELGKIIQARGLKGDVIARIAPELTTLDPIKYIFIKIGSTLVPHQLEEANLHGSQALLKFQGIEDSMAARELINKTIWLPEETLQQILAKEETDEDITGYHVTDMEQGKLGIIEYIEEFPMHQCLVINYKNNQLLIPYVPNFIQQVDHKKKELLIQLPPGFLEAMGCNK
jgi:16S rRNA processing protein RimM